MRPPTEAAPSVGRRWVHASAACGLAQHLSRDAMRLVRGWNAAIHGQQQENLLNLLRTATVLHGSVEMHAQFVGVPSRRHHRHHGERLRRRRQYRPAPDIPVGVSVDDVLQRFAELAERAHALFDRLAAEHVDAQLEAALMKLFLVHCRFPFDNTAGVKSYCCGMPAVSRTVFQRLYSFARNFPNSSGVELLTTTPTAAMRVFTASSARLSLSVLFSFAMTAGGAPRGANTPYQVVTS